MKSSHTCKTRAGRSASKRPFRRLLAAAALAFAAALPAANNAAAAETVYAYDTVRLTLAIGSEQRTVDIRLLPDAAPGTATNFLKYVNSKALVGTFFHRSVANFVVQGGGYKWDDKQGPVNATSYGTIKNEFSLRNIRGTLAMAKLGGDPDSASNQWFVNIADNRANLDNQNGGFTVFAELANADSLAVFDFINNPAYVPVTDLYKGYESPFGEVPTPGGNSLIVIASATLIQRDAMINDRVHSWVAGDGLWNTSSADNWKIVNGNGVARPFAQWNEALFDNTAGQSRTITLGEDVGVSDLHIKGDGGLLIQGAGKSIVGRPNGYILSSTAALVKEGVNTALFNNVKLDFSGGAHVEEGHLVLAQGSELTGGASVAAGSQLTFDASKLNGPILLRAGTAEVHFTNGATMPGTPSTTGIFGTGHVTSDAAFVNTGFLSPGLGDTVRSAGVISINAPSFKNEGALLLEIESPADHDIIRNTGAGNIVIGGKLWLDASATYLALTDNTLDLSVFLESAPGAGTIAFDYAALDISLVDITYLVKSFDTTTGLLTLQRNIGSLPGIRSSLTKGGQSFAQSLNYVAANDGGSLANYLSAQADPARTVSSLSPLGYAAMTAMPLAVAADAANSIRSHLAGLRALAAAPKPAAAETGSTAFPATKPPPFDPTLLSFYVHGNGSFAKNGNGDDQPFFNADTYGATAGIDLAVTKKFSAGANVGLNTGRATMHDDAGKVRFSQVRVAGYATLAPADWLYVDGAIHAGFSDYNATRHPTPGGINNADARGYDLGALLHVGSRIPLGKTFAVNPYAGVEFTRAAVNSFNEELTADADLPFHIDAFDQYSLRAKIGVEATWQPEPYLAFSLFADYSHELLDTEAAIKGRLLDYKDAPRFKVKAPATSQGILQAGPQATLRLYSNAYVSLAYAYGTDLEKMTSHSISANFTWKF